MAGFNNWIDIDVRAKSCILDFSNFTPMSKEDAIDHTVESITSKYDNLYVALSGGIDSEFIAKTLHERGIKFIPVILDFTLNSAEIWYAYYWCYKNNITPHTIKIPINEVSEKFSAIATKTNEPFICAVDFIIEEYVSSNNGHLLCGGSEPFDRDLVFSDRMIRTTSDDLDMCSYEFALDTAFPNKHPNGFLVHTPELLFSIVRDLDYSKPVQIAMSEYYGVAPRPKLPYIFNVGLDQKMLNNAIQINSTIQADSIIIGDKNYFLEKALNKQKIYCSYERRK